jgi:hypothetical protein
MLDCTTLMMVSVVTYCSSDDIHFFQKQNLQSLLLRTGDDADYVVVQMLTTMATGTTYPRHKFLRLLSRILH